MTSVKQLSKDLNISTVRLYQIINELPETQKPSKKGNRYIFTDKDIVTIKERFKQTTYNLTKVSNDKSANQLIHQLNKQIESLTKQINIKDKQIEKLTQLVDQSQQLVLYWVCLKPHPLKLVLKCGVLSNQVYKRYFNS